MRFTLPEHKKLTYQMEIPVRWGDMDAMGHVNNTIYFRYFEIARLEWLYSVGATSTPVRVTGRSSSTPFATSFASWSFRAPCWPSITSATRAAAASIPT